MFLDRRLTIEHSQCDARPTC